MNVQIGDHAELILKDGLYSKLVRAQADGLVWFKTRLLYVASPISHFCITIKTSLFWD